MAERTFSWQCHKHMLHCTGPCPGCARDDLSWPVVPVRKSLDDCTPGEWDSASKAVGRGSGSAQQPEPVVTKNPHSWDLVLADMAERDQFGKSKYGTNLQPGNGRDALADAYQEALDLAVYLRTAMYERDGK